jgi:hypothetical protein
MEIQMADETKVNEDVEDKVISWDDINKCLEDTKVVEKEIVKVGEEIKNVGEGTEGEDSKGEGEDKKVEDKELEVDKTKLGRKFKVLQDQFFNLSTKLDALLNMQMSNSKQVDSSQSSDEDDEIITLSKLKSILPAKLEEISREKDKTKNDYENAFAHEVVNVLGNGMDEGKFNEVTQIMLKDYNEKATGNPKIDAQLAFVKAERDWTSLNSIDKKKINLKEETPSKHIDSTVKVNTEDSFDMNKLDPAARAYAERVKLSPGDIKKMLGLK